MEKKKTDRDQFIELDVKKLKQIEVERKRLLSSDLQEMPDIHLMHCPRCNRNLENKIITDMALVTCAQCKGIWLEADNLAKIIRVSDEQADNFLNLCKKIIKYFSY